MAAATVPRRDEFSSQEIAEANRDDAVDEDPNLRLTVLSPGHLSSLH
jgi:hypothetical protein